MVRWVMSDEGVDWEAFAEVYRKAPLGDKEASIHQKAFSNSMYKCFAYSGDRLVGGGRALADGVDCSYLADVVVHPDFQGQGIGKAIVNKLIELSKGHRKIILYAAPGKEPLYAKLGFKKMKTAMAIFANELQAMEWGLVENHE